MTRREKICLSAGLTCEKDDFKYCTRIYVHISEVSRVSFIHAFEKKKKEKKKTSHFNAKFRSRNESAAAAAAAASVIA